MTMAMEKLLEQEYPDYFTAKNIEKMDAVENLLKKKGTLNVKKVADSGIYSKSLCRIMTIAEAIKAGLF